MTSKIVTIEKVKRDQLCTGCGTCLSICPNLAIQMSVSPNGIYLPQIDFSICQLCGACFEVCPGHSMDFKHINKQVFSVHPDPLLGCYLQCYVGYSTNEEVRYSSASGGLITQILIYALERGLIDGAIVTKMDKTHPLKPHVFIARTKNELLKSARSKYCPVPVNSIIREILQMEEDERFAIVGLPCHIQGIRKAEQKNARLKKRIVLHLGLICTHTPTFHETQFLLSDYGINELDVQKIDYRGQGWPGDMSIKLSNGKKVVIPHFSPLYLGIAFHLFFIPNHCMVCNDKLCKLADISFGDAWIPDLVKDKQGTSLIIVRNTIGERILQDGYKVNAIILKDAHPEVVRRSQSIVTVKKQRKALKNMFQSIGKPIPFTNQSIPTLTISDYIFSLLFYLLNQTFSRRSLWRLTKSLSFLIGRNVIMKKVSARGYYFHD